MNTHGHIANQEKLPAATPKWMGREAGILHLCDTAQPSQNPPNHYCHDDNMRANKLWILNLGYKTYGDQPKSDAATLHRLAKPQAQDFQYEQRQDPTKQHPPYFDKPLSSIKLPSHAGGPQRYPYIPEPGVTSYWVDFADTFLGGGVFGNGFLQEETMCLEIPELANAAGLRWIPGENTLYIRDPKNYPIPLVILNTWRTVNIAANFGKVITDHSTLSDIDKYVSRVDPPQAVNTLSMAAPKVAQGQEQTLSVICDLFNTFVAGFTLARQTGSPPIHINTGPIGTGSFGNNRVLVYILQVLAAMHAQIDKITLYGYDPTQDPDKKAEDLLGANPINPNTSILSVLTDISKWKIT